jgi:hypothetical protein
MNALKHGNRSRKLALLREESSAFEERLRKWMAIGDAQSDVEEYLIYRNVHLSFELDRVERARVERCTMLIENSDEDEVAEAQAVGKQLFFDPAGPTPLYGNPTFFSRKKKTSWNGQAVDPNDPAVLVKILERNAAGCCWLREQWQALRSQLESAGFWQSQDRLKATRLLGRQPVEANEDLRIATIFVASHALQPSGQTEFDDLLSDMEDRQRDRYGQAVRERWPDLFRTREKEEWRQILLTLADQNINRLTAKLEVHEQNADAQAERTLARLSFDPSPEGEALRNYLIKCTNALFRGMANYRKYQATTRDRRDGASGVGRHGTQQDRSEDSGREPHERDGSELGADDSFGSGNGLDDRLERADVIDPDGVEQHGDLLSGTGAIGENAPSEETLARTPGDLVPTLLRGNGSPGRSAVCGPRRRRASKIGRSHAGAWERASPALTELPSDGNPVLLRQTPNEANFDETMSIVEAQEPIQVTADSGALSGLDNGAAQSGEGSTPEQGKAPGSGSESGNPEPQTPDSRDQARRGNLPTTVSKPEQTRLQLEEERRAVERMVEEKLKAGNFSLREILTSAMALPPSGGRGR